MKKKKWILPAVLVLLSASNAFALQDSKLREIILPDVQSNVSINQGFEYSIIQKASITSLNATLITQFFGASAFAQYATGEKRQDPFNANILTAGLYKRDAFEKEQGKAYVFAGAFGGRKVIGDFLLGGKIKLGSFKGSTDIDITQLGAQEEDGSFYSFSASVLNLVNDVGFSANYANLSENEKSNYGAISSEDLSGDNVFVRFRFPILQSRLSVEPSFRFIKEESDVHYSGSKPGDILVIDRLIESEEKNTGLHFIYYRDFLRKDQIKVGGGFFSGTIRHEYEAPKVRGFYANIEYGFGNTGKRNFAEPAKIIRISYSEQDSKSKTISPSYDPQTGVPINLIFDETRDENVVSVGYESPLFGLGLEYSQFHKSGTTDIRVPLMDNIKIPLAKASLEEDYLTVFGTKKIGNKWETKAKYTHGFDDDKRAFNLGFQYSF